MKDLGVILLVVAIAVAVFALFYFNVSVTNGNGDHFANLGLMDERRNMLIGAGFVGVIGAVFMVGGKRAAKK